METIVSKLDYYIQANCIPNLLFHGPQLSNICSIMTNFVNRIYHNDTSQIQKYVITVNCGYCKGIKFIRDDLKFFSKTYTPNPTVMFKSVVLINADKLTIDAQSALRRCIEIFSNTTRFFICGEAKYKLLNPILSRFCDIYVPHVPSTLCLYIEPQQILDTKTKYLKTAITNMSISSKSEGVNIDGLLKLSEKLYVKSYCSNDIIHLLQYDGMFNRLTKHRYELMFVFNKIKSEFRNEDMLLFFMLYMVSTGLSYSGICDRI
jgi:DNA polymerase III delta prime subunit